MKRLERNETGRAPQFTTEQLYEKMYEKVEIEPMSGCHLFYGSATVAGYGQLSNKVRGRVYAHRVAYERAYGHIPVGMHVLHRCDVTCCVNPSHLFLGTQIDNNNDKIMKGRAKGGSMKGEDHPSVKFTEEQIKEMRASFQSGEKQVEIARRYGTSQGYVSNIIRRLNWRHV